LWQIKTKDRAFLKLRARLADALLPPGLVSSTNAGFRP